MPAPGTAYVRLRQHDGSTLLIEAAATPGDDVTFLSSSPARPVEIPEAAFQKGIGTAASLAQRFRATFRSLGAEAPDSVEMSFGLKVAAEGNIWVAKASSEAQITLKVGWKRNGT